MVDQILKKIPTELIDPPPSPRRLEPSDTEIEALSDSIKSIGLINPITVAPQNGRFVVVAGHRRYLACKHADNLHLVITLTENLARQDLSPIEEAATLKELQDSQGWGLKNLAKHTGKSTQWIRDRLALLDIPPDLQILVHTKQIGVAHAFVLANIDDDSARRTYAKEAISQSTGVKTLQLWVDLYIQSHSPIPGLQIEDNENGQEPTAQRYLIKCSICDDHFQPQQLRSLILCKDCLNHIVEAKRGNINLHGDAHDVDPGRDPRLGDKDRAQAHED